MLLFFQILLANIVLLFVLIAVHEAGHWFFGRLAGLPRAHMRIKLLTFPQQVVLRDGDEWISVSSFERYFTLLQQFVPSPRGRFLYVVGGFAAETLFLGVLTIAIDLAGYRLYAIIVPALSLTMYLVYVFAMDIPRFRATRRPWGDMTILYTLAPCAAAGVGALMVTARAVLISAAAMGWLW